MILLGLVQNNNPNTKISDPYPIKATDNPSTKLIRTLLNLVVRNEGKIIQYLKTIHPPSELDNIHLVKMDVFGGKMESSRFRIS